MRKRCCDTILLIFLVAAFCLSGIFFQYREYTSLEASVNHESVITNTMAHSHILDTASKEVSGSKQEITLSFNEESCRTKYIQLSAYLLFFIAILFKITLFQSKNCRSKEGCGHGSHLRLIVYIQEKDGKKRA